MQPWKKKTVVFLVSQGITLFGSSLVQFAIVWYVTLKTSSGAWVSALTVCSFLPQFFISCFSGVWADRYPRKRLIILSDAAIAVSTLALALLMPLLERRQGAVCGAAHSVRHPVPRRGRADAGGGAMVPQLVPGGAAYAL
jgi:DHA3 family macrolide efflux protein-like MFS transporter